jgi:Dolichyl-phosphate-mannose-protein mannosyltransferase
MPAARPAWLEKLESRRELVYPIGTAILAMLLLLPLLGSYGLWDPQEFPLADFAREVSRTGDYASVFATKPPLSVWLSAAGVSLLGPSELAVRLPHALFGVLGALAAYGIGRRLRTPRAGVLAAAVLLTAPLYLFQARQLTTDMGALAGSAIAVFGLVGLAWPRAQKPAWLALDVLATLVGLTLGFLGHGLVLGVGVPLAALAFASGAAATVAAAGPDRRRQVIVALVAGLVALAVFAYWFELRDHKGYAKLLGGAFRTGNEPPPNATFDYLVNQLAFGMYPWSAVAPIAVLRLLLVRRGDRDAWAGILVIAWAAAAYMAGALWMREMGDLRYPGLVAIAIAVGILLDDLLAARDGEPARWPAARFGLPLLALFVLCASVQLGRDIKEFPEQLASVHLLQELKFPPVLKLLPRVLMWFGALFGLAFAFGVGTAPAPGQLKREPIDRSDLDPTSVWLLDLMAKLGSFLAPLFAPLLALARRFALPAAIVLALLMGLFLSMVYTPTLSEHFSYKNVFDSYQALHRDDEPVGVMGISGSGPDFYAHGKLEKLNDLGALTSFLRRDSRVFAVAPATELCAIQQAATTGGFPYYVATAENSRFFLYTNRLGPGERDANPLSRMIFRQPPASIPTPFSAKFVPPSTGQAGEIELLGFDMPKRVKKGSTFTVKLFFKVNAKVSQNYQIFAHFDKGVRFQGDHWPLGNLCGTQYWQVGDYVVDSFDVTAGEALSPKGTYEVYVGFFTGGAGNWRNMTVTTGNADKNNRVRIGTIDVR